MIIQAELKRKQSEYEGEACVGGHDAGHLHALDL
mgnify:CR=1 FL=1